MTPPADDVPVRPGGPSARELDPPTPDRVSVAVGAVVVTLAAHNIVSHRAVHRDLHLPINLALGGLLVALGRSAGLSASEMGLDPARVPDGTRHGVLAAGAVIAVAAAGAAWPRTRHLYVDEAVAAASPRRAAYEAALRIPLGTATFEEVAFRGVLDPLLARRLPGTAAALASSALFGLWHVVPTLDRAPDRPTTAPRSRAVVLAGHVALTAVAGLGFRWLHERSGSLLAPVLAHAATNVAGYLAARLVRAGSGTRDRAERAPAGAVSQPAGRSGPRRGVAHGAQADGDPGRLHVELLRLLAPLAGNR